MQQAIALLQGEKKGDYRDGVAVGRALFEALPENNRIVKRDRERWSLENHQDECFADMYVHPQEVDYTIDTLFELIDASGLTFVGFSNPSYWDLNRLIDKAPELIERAKQLSERQQYRLIELLDPELTHYEFFLARPPLTPMDWSNDAALSAAYAQLSPCLSAWPSQTFFDPNYQLITLSDEEYTFLQACESAGGKESIAAICQRTKLDLNGVRALHQRQLLLLTPSS